MIREFETALNVLPTGKVLGLQTDTLLTHAIARGFDAELASELLAAANLGVVQAYMEETDG